MPTTDLGDTRVRGALSDASRWARVLALSWLAVLALLTLAGVAFALAWSSSALPPEISDAYREAFAQAGWGAFPPAALAVAGAIGVVAFAAQLVLLLAFGRALRAPRGANLADARVGEAFGHLAVAMKVAAAYQLLSLTLSIGLLAYGLLTGT